MEGLLYLEDGSMYRGKGFGAPATKVGELIFNTSMTGYQEMLTDPSRTGQIINMTYPLIGNYGISEIDNQSDRVRAFGLVIRDITYRPSNRCSVMSLSDWLEKEDVPGVYNVDTRAITKKIRSKGTMKCVISNEGFTKERAMELIEKTPLRSDYMKEAGTMRPMTVKEDGLHAAAGEGLRIAVLDFGITRGAFDALTRRGMEVTLFPYGATADEILSGKPDGLFLPNGPGDPVECDLGIKTAAALMEKLPTFGICLGHQVIALAAGAKTYKLKFGHHGGNHGVKELATGKSAIVGQGHSFVVDADSMRDTDMVVTHLNLNDGTVEGIRHESLPVFSVQFHPGGPPGPSDAEELYDRFVQMVLKVRSGEWKGGGFNA